MDDQGLVNTDPRNIAVPNTWVNLVPTDIRGLTFSRTPQMVSCFCVYVLNFGMRLTVQLLLHHYCPISHGSI